MKDEKLTLEQFNNIPYRHVMGSGVITNSPEGIYMTTSGGSLKWIAKKGGGNDWAIYIHWHTSTDDFILTQGDKVVREEDIKKCVPCTDEVFNLYRY